MTSKKFHSCRRSLGGVYSIFASIRGTFVGDIYETLPGDFESGFVFIWICLVI